MRICKSKLYIAMANACVEAADIVATANIPRSTFSSAARGKSVRPVTIGKIARALGVPVTEILDEDTKED